jgi:RNA polymerase sigma factor for flagellar operon FliA
MASPNAVYQANTGSHSSAREQLILDHLGMVRWIALRIHDKLPNGPSLEDLISIGTIGLISAVDNFDPEQGAKLSTYAEYRIRGAILDAVRELDGIPAHQRKKAKQIEAAIAAAEQRLQCSASDEDIASELRITLDEYREWLFAVRGVTIGSLDAVGENENRKSCLLMYLADPEENLPAVRVERAELERLLAEAIEQLPEKEKLVLDLYYTQEQNLREISEIMGVHFTRVSQLKAQAVLRLRASLQQLWPTKRGVM